MRSLAFLALLAFAGAAQAQTFTVTPASSAGPFTVAWDVPGGTNCQAAGIADWSGAVASSGSKSVQPALGAHSLSLTCTVPGGMAPGSVHLRWSPAASNTDGTPYTNAQGYLVFADTVTPPAKSVQSVLSPATLDYTVANLAAGHWYFGVKSLAINGAVSDLSAIVDKVVVDVPVTQPWTGSASITVLAPARPNPPVLSIVP